MSCANGPRRSSRLLIILSDHAGQPGDQVRRVSEVVVGYDFFVPVSQVGSLRLDALLVQFVAEDLDSRGAFPNGGAAAVVVCVRVGDK
jgi:hypothetical protein